MGSCSFGGGLSHDSEMRLLAFLEERDIAEVGGGVHALDREEMDVRVIRQGSGCLTGVRYRDIGLVRLSDCPVEETAGLGRVRVEPVVEVGLFLVAGYLSQRLRGRHVQQRERIFLLTAVLLIRRRTIEKGLHYSLLLLITNPLVLLVLLVAVLHNV